MKTIMNHPIHRVPMLVLAFILVFSAASVGAQTENLAKTNRWERQIQAYEASDRTNPPPMNAVLFTGASAFLSGAGKMWDEGVLRPQSFQSVVSAARRCLTWPNLPDAL